MSVPAPDPAELQKRYIDNAHSGGGTYCRCCEIVERGYLAALLAGRRQDKERIGRLKTLKWAAENVVREWRKGKRARDEIADLDRALANEEDT